jgi:serine/threonine protein phosphatase PrpC
MLRVSLGQHTRAGRKEINQDFHGAAIPKEPLLSNKGIALAIADGIGSSPVSQLASAAAVRGFLDDYLCTTEAWSVQRSGQRVLQATNSWLHTQNQRSDARFDRDRGQVCTFSALILKGNAGHVLHVGDTRVCQFHAKALEPLTQDHRVQVSASETYLGRALGVGPSVEVDHRTWTLNVGDVYLLSTDGVHEFIDAADVHQALAAHPADLDAAASALADMAFERGSPDNLTLQIVRVQELGEAAVHTLHQQRAELTLPPPLQARMSFEGYTIVRPLHASSRSHVHLAIDELSGQHVALKTPSVDMREQPDYLDRFLLEEWVARRLDSPHVLKPCGLPRPRQHLFVAMEYIEGQTLAQWMNDHRHPDLDSVRQVIDQVAKGLQAFHRREMLHQDLRPENIMIDRTGTVRIIDFASVHVAGLAEGSEHARADALLGSLQYTAPEYMLGHGGTAASDLFSLAVLTYQMLTGQLPYGLQVARLREPAEVKKLRYVPLRDHRPDLPAWLDIVLRRALHPDPHRRHEALSEFMHELTARGSAAHHHRGTPLIERNPVAFWRGLSLLLAVGCLVLLGLRLTGR